MENDQTDMDCIMGAGNASEDFFIMEEDGNEDRQIFALLGNGNENEDPQDQIPLPVVEQHQMEVEPGISSKAEHDTPFASTSQTGENKDSTGFSNEINVNTEPLEDSRQYRIEVVLTPPADPEAYARVELGPSWFVEKVLDEVDIEGETWYSVQFDDGRIDQLAYDDTTQLPGGSSAVQKFQAPRFANSSMDVIMDDGHENYLEDDSEEFDSESSDSHSRPSKKARMNTLRTRPQAIRVQPTRRSSRQASQRLSIGASSDDQDGNAPQRSTAASKSGRVTRSQHSTATKPTYNLSLAANNDSDDELAQAPESFVDEGEEEFIPVTSDLALKKTTRSSTRKRLRPKKSYASSRVLEDDSDIEFEPARRSGRTGRFAKSMKDPDVDDDYGALEEKTVTVPKLAAVKEIFQPLPSDSEFPAKHYTNCDACQTAGANVKGPLIYCQGCSLSYHKACLGVRSQRDHRVTKISSDNFVLQCRYCIGVYRQKDVRAPNHAMCQTCKLEGPSCKQFSVKKTPKQEERERLENGDEDPITSVNPSLVDNPDNVLFRCAHCRRGWHLDHLSPLGPELEIPEDLKMERLQEYSIDWSCKDCLEAEQKPATLVAWRPVDQDAYRPGQESSDMTEDGIEYLVKWDGRSHFHDTWMPGAWVYGAAASAMRTSFHKRDDNRLPKMDSASAIEEEWLLPDVILDVKYHRGSHLSSKARDISRINDISKIWVKFQGLGYEEAVWDEPPSPTTGAPYKAFCAAYDEFLNGRYFASISDLKMKERIAHYRSLNFGKEAELKSQPSRLKRGKLMEYQLEGVNFLLYNFQQRSNVILADEMGLGKTIQVVAFIASLVYDQPKCWPFLIVVPNATCANWRRELKHWAPDLRVVAYYGGKVAQDLAYRHELFPGGVREGLKAHVVITSFEAAGNLRQQFQTVKWVGLIVDEGQRLKNEGTQLYKALQEMKIPCRILLTGTPLQNNKRELFNLLQFIDTKNNAEELDAKYAELTKENLPELHKLIKPYFLRRTKVQVLKFLPPMSQIIVPVTMTVLQEKISKSIMARNPNLIKAIISKSKVKAADRKSLNNILSDLRQCLCHPFCFSSDIEDRTVSPQQMHRNLIEASPKLLLLELMLPKLKERGHRVLIFSQFLFSLTIIEDFLTGLGLLHARIDGSQSALEKQKRIDAFNAPGSPLFAMLLSTRAGGVGINLATADTVIIYDPDFNPHQDIQAISRAHRIGQKEKVLCFQLTTKNTVEEKIMQVGRKKMALDHALIETLDNKNQDAGEDLESILSHGAAALFSDGFKDHIVYDHASVDKLLDRSQIESTDTGDDESAETQFSLARVWANDTLTSNDDDGSSKPAPVADHGVWESILKQREEEHERELAAAKKVYGRGARRHSAKAVQYNHGVRPGPDSGDSDADVDDELYIDNNNPAEVEDEYDSEGSAGNRRASRKSKEASVPEAPKPQEALPRAQNNLANQGQLNQTGAAPRRGRPRKYPLPSATPTQRRSDGPRKDQGLPQHNKQSTMDLVSTKQQPTGLRPAQPVSKNPQPMKRPSLNLPSTHPPPTSQPRGGPAPSPRHPQPTGQLPMKPPSNLQATKQVSKAVFPPRPVPSSMVPNQGIPPQPWPNAPNNSSMPFIQGDRINTLAITHPQTSSYSYNSTNMMNGAHGDQHGHLGLHSCAVCGGSHTSLAGCVDLRSASSIRLALDGLRNRTSSSQILYTRDYLQRVLRGMDMPGRR
ncbi:PHD/FYVE-zinc-finger like domain-containing protein [Xylariomycetidae sp. FL2044]|nr:PHD/FYVE-zinc-finger like domain-containing protein [Xylariomycetidae sp. FL2044]